MEESPERLTIGRPRLLLRVFVNPLATKELRSTLRQRRFLWIYWISLSLCSILVLVGAWARVDEASLSEGEPVGQIILAICTVAQAGLIMIVLPGFAATAISEERDRKSYDMIVTTALQPIDIIWGKFCACMSYALLFLASTLPLVCISVLFTGVRPQEIICVYVVMVMSATFMVSYGLCVSSISGNSKRSTAVTYITSAVLSGGLYLFATSSVAAMPSSYGDYGYISFWYDQLWHSSTQSFLWYTLAPVLVWILGTSLCLIVSINRLKPASANKATAVRVTLSLLLAPFLLIIVGSISEPQQSSPYLWRIVLIAIIQIPVTFAATCESPILSRRIYRQYVNAQGFRIPYRIFLPGCSSGLTYSLLFSGMSILTVWHGLNMMLFDESVVAPNLEKALNWTAGLLLVTCFAYACLGRLLATIFSPPLHARTVLCFVLVMATLLPVCVLAVQEQMVPANNVREITRSPPWGFHFTSSILAIRSVWAEVQFQPLGAHGFFYSNLKLQFFGEEFAVFELYMIVHITAGLGCFWAGHVRQKKITKEVNHRDTEV